MPKRLIRVAGMTVVCIVATLLWIAKDDPTSPFPEMLPLEAQAGVVPGLPVRHAFAEVNRFKIDAFLLLNSNYFTVLRDTVTDTDYLVNGAGGICELRQ